LINYLSHQSNIYLFSIKLFRGGGTSSEQDCGSGGIQVDGILGVLMMIFGFLIGGGPHEKKEEKKGFIR
jgi:hypothetical protein